MTAPANPLVAERQDSTTAISGIGIAESAVDLYNGISSGSWSEIAIGGGGMALETVGLVIDPIGSLVAAGISWLIEHVKPLTDALDWLAGDPDTIASYAQTWRNVAGAVNGAQQSFTTAVAQQTAQWTGSAGDAYRTAATRQADQLTATATASDSIGSVVEIVGVLVGVVREIVRDLVAECIATLVARVPQWLAEAGLTLGLATPHVVASAVTLISRWVRRIADVIQKLIRSINNLRPLLRRLDEIWEALRTGFRRAPGGPDAPAPASPDVPAPDPVRAPGTEPPTVSPDPSASTTPQGTAAPGSVTAPPSTGGTGTPATTSPSGATASVTDPAAPATTGPASGTTTGHTTGTGVATSSPGSPSTGPINHYDPAGRTIPTDNLTHPNASLLDRSLLDSAAANPDRVSDALRPGVDTTNPAVQNIVQPSYHRFGFDSHGNPMTEPQWNSEYWPSGGYDARGNRELNWPDPQQHPDGFARPEDRRPTVLNPGETIDRFGPGFGRYASPPDTPYPERGLPPDNLYDLRDPSRPGVSPGDPLPSYHRYEVVRPIPVWEGAIAPAMGQPGGGTQYYLPEAIVDLVNAGYLREIPL